MKSFLLVTLGVKDLEKFQRVWWKVPKKQTMLQEKNVT